LNKNEADLVRQIARGDESAFRTLVENHQVQVYNVCLGFFRNAEEAEDIAQEVFIHIYNRIDAFRAESSLSTWIYRITVNKCLEHIRSQKRKKRWAKLVSLFSSDSDEHLSIGDYDHPGVILENKERAAILKSKIDELPENQRIAFTLHKFESLSYAEIANVMQLSLSSVESLMHRAKKNLQNKLKAFYESDRK
jgi:RNA polymerase sigma-70 factor (ECF subfamily)